eukprot:3713416-Amphidinium_carterae.1
MERIPAGHHCRLPLRLHNVLLARNFQTAPSYAENPLVFAKNGFLTSCKLSMQEVAEGLHSCCLHSGAAYQSDSYSRHLESICCAKMSRPTHASHTAYTTHMRRTASD